MASVTQLNPASLPDCCVSFIGWSFRGSWLIAAIFLPCYN